MDQHCWPLSPLCKASRNRVCACSSTRLTTATQRDVGKKANIKALHMICKKIFYNNVAKKIANYCKKLDEDYPSSVYAKKMTKKRIYRFVNDLRGYWKYEDGKRHL